MSRAGRSRPARARSRPRPARAARRASGTAAGRRSGRRAAPAARGDRAAAPAHPRRRTASGAGCRSAASPRRRRAGPPASASTASSSPSSSDAGCRASAVRPPSARARSGAGLSSPTRSGPAPMRPSTMPVGVHEHRPGARAARPRRRASGPSPRPDRRAGPAVAERAHRAVHRSAAAAGARRRRAGRGAAPASISTSQSVVNSRGRWRSCSNTRQSVSITTGWPRRRAAARARSRAGTAPIAASSAPCPQTSPIRACSVPSPSSTRSKKSPPSSARRRPGRLHEADQTRGSAISGLGREAAFEPLDLARLGLGEQQLALGFLGRPATDGVADRAPELAGLEPSLDEVVLRARLRQRRCRADSSARPVRTTSGAPPSRARRRRRPSHAGGVGKAEVEQDAIDAFRAARRALRPGCAGARACSRAAFRRARPGPAARRRRRPRRAAQGDPPRCRPPALPTPPQRILGQTSRMSCWTPVAENRHGFAPPAARVARPG